MEIDFRVLAVGPDGKVTEVQRGNAPQSRFGNPGGTIDIRPALAAAGWDADRTCIYSSSMEALGRLYPLVSERMLPHQVVAHNCIVSARLIVAMCDACMHYGAVVQEAQHVAELQGFFTDGGKSSRAQLDDIRQAVIANREQAQQWLADEERRQELARAVQS